ncbi:MAG: hypothetical protein GYA20_06600 [Chloroflexi bacterium]|nr:hypothetical protein [Chloroflexota bacterium]
MTQPHHRHSIRLRGYDYTAAGAYFITICTHGRACLFGPVVDGEMRLSEIGKIAQAQWDQIPARFENVEMGPNVVMPNHMHGILIVRAGLAPAPGVNMRQPQGPGQPQGLPLPKTVGDIVGAYKSLVVNECLKVYKSQNRFLGKVWQRNYYEHIIRDEQSYENIAAYILNNPRQWDADQLFKAG